MTLDQVMKKIDDGLTTVCKTSVKILSLTGLIYIGAFTLSHELVTSNYRLIREENPETMLKINYENHFNPIKFDQDHKFIIEQGSDISKNKKYAPFSVISITGG